MLSFGRLPRHYFGAIYADPPWAFNTWGTQENASTDVNRRYRTLQSDTISKLDVASLAAKDCVLFMWVTWPTIEQAFHMISSWGFKYKTCAFSWMKADATAVQFFSNEKDVSMGCGYWTRSNSEVCLLATRGKPKRLHSDVRQGIVEPRREHSRKPDCVYGRIERLVAGPYIELFARTTRKGWSSWGNETTKFKS
jgi:N6-adenosine-specific RNA methylase IME4